MSSLWNPIKYYWTGVSAISYSPLRLDGLDITEDHAKNVATGIDRHRKLSLRALTVSFCFLLGSIALHAVLLLNVPSDGYCERKMWAWSPIIGVSKYMWHQWDSDILPDSLYGGPPTAERRDAWEHIVEDGFISFPKDHMKAIQKSEDVDWWSLPYPNQDQVIAGPEYYHQLHCVRLLWLAALRDEWDYTNGGSMSPLRYDIHTKHCYFALKRMLECQADITPVLFEESDNGHEVWETRNAPHKCKNFPTLLQWHADHTVCGRPCKYN